MANPVARIDLGALRHNLQRVREAAPGCKVFATIKSNAYGHGIVDVARALDAADAFAVARVEEGLDLRSAGFDRDILILGGAANSIELKLAYESGFQLAIHHHNQLELLKAFQFGDQPLRVWLKVDSGMHRLGFTPAETASAKAVLSAIGNLECVGVMTHLANADDRDDATTDAQLAAFEPFCEPALEVSIANSAGILGWPESRRGWVRPGIMLYGASPFIDSSATDEGLQPVMTLRTKLIAVRKLKAGDPVGYGGTWVAPHDINIGVAAIGYGDGYPRHAPSGTPILVDGVRTEIIGRVSMDLLTIDLTPAPNARVGDSVVCWGAGLPVEDVARSVGTISYELFCRLTGRVKFRYEE